MGPARAAVATGIEALELAASLLWARVLEGLHEGRWTMGTSEHWVADLRYAGRALRRAPAFSLVVVTTLALAIGANTAIFSVVDAVLLNPLPFENADRLVSIQGTAPGSELEGEFGVPDELFVAYREQSDLIDDIGLYGVVQSTMRAGENVERLFMARVTPSFFSTLGVSAARGRIPTDADAGDVVVISHRLWSTWFGSDPDIIGTAHDIAGAQRTVVGVMGPDFLFPDERGSLWIPVTIDPSALTPGGFDWGVVARLAPGATPEALTSELSSVAATMPERLGGPRVYAEIMSRHQALVRPLEDELVGDIAGPLWMLLGTVGVVLLIACANVANLFIARSESRRQDLAVRHALGSGRSGLVRIQMSEALLLAAAGGALGTFVAGLGVPLLISIAPEGVPRLGAATLDFGALVFAGAVSLLAAIAFGLVPALGFSRPTLVSGVRDAGGSGGSTWARGRDALIVVQTASAFVLLVGAALLLQSFWHLSHVDPGYEIEDIFTFQIAPSGEDLNDGPSYARFHYAFMDRIAALPGVESVGVVNQLPLDEGAGDTFFQTEHTEAGEQEEPLLRVTMTGGDYFATMGIELLAGRVFDRIDGENGLTEAIVGKALADFLWPGEEPLGQRIRPRGAPMWWTVIGVVEDVFLQDFRQSEPERLLYLPMVGPSPRLYAVASPAYVVKSPNAASLAGEIRELAREADPNSPMYRVFTMEGLAARSMAELSFTMLTLGIAAGLALVLGAVGLFGVLSYAVSQRTREIGVRMALGARADQVRLMVMAQGARVVVIGLTMGMVAALALTRLLRGLLFDVPPGHAPTFVAMSLFLLGVAVLASYLPARRASGVDPMRSLRTE